MQICVLLWKRDVYFDEHNNNNNNKVDVSEDFVDDIHAENNSIKEPLCEESGEDESSSGEYHSVDESVIRELQSEEEREKISRGRPKIVRTGKRGRPKKVYNTLNTLREKET
ncbi:hypothetical protein EVAR_103769_1 [Eumeta japonica]|uniref:Uncharacterized protein n=1 Tax=Eumeta variegata TaxID=151549 RepID=A0A4C1ZS62_EUMVA|nr:hypothetical protein EVAR_103769_1 [Eumeta japonica]